MTKRDLVVQIARQTGVTQSKVKLVVEGVLEKITEALASGEKIELRNFGILKVKTKKARVGRNPKTGEIVSIAPKKGVSFRPGKILKKKVEKS